MASSLRVKTVMPMAAMTPPKRRTIWAKALASCSQEMIRPVLRESTPYDHEVQHARPLSLRVCRLLLGRLARLAEP